MRTEVAGNSAGLPAGLAMAAHAACFWPVWRWYVERLDDGSDEPWALVALLAAVALSWPRAGWRWNARDPLLLAAAACTLLYALLAPFAPPLPRALLAMAALGCSWISVGGARDKLPAVICLLLLSVPVIASLQFYAGYPLRTVTASGATALLNLFGGEVVRAGTSMVEHGRTVVVDAPCSGVRMLWTGSLLCAVLAAMRARIGWRAMLLSLGCVLPIVLAANAVRAALLFLLETADTPPAGWLHPAVGMLAFAMVGGSLLLSEHLQTRRRKVRRAPRFAVPT
ncbi:MAG TPA: archaeosortase/exosortase family protein [Steroidobacteraceae bacterium]|nr:archaeosortase/exosortase family protein [Steroidobacteraceae bacterium]